MWKALGPGFWAYAFRWPWNLPLIFFTHVEYQFCCWKYSLIFSFFLNLETFVGFFFHFLGSSEFLLGMESASKIVLGPTYVDYQLLSICIAGSCWLGCWMNRK